MREIKFRYFMQRKGKMMIPLVLTLHAIEQDRHKFNGNFKMIARDQFTGLQDKNGNDIYEGDILMVLLDAYDRGIGAVTHDTKQCRYRVLTNNPYVNHLCFLIDDHHHQYEVLGNIHEHSSLLEKAEA